MINDPLGDMLNRIRNAQMRRRPKVTSPASMLRARVLEVLADKGYIQSYTLMEPKNGLNELGIKLKYANGQPAIREIPRVSAPGRRVYRPVRDLRAVSNEGQAWEAHDRHSHGRSPPVVSVETTMDWGRIEGNWKQFSGKVREQAGKLTDDDLTFIRGDRDQLKDKGSTQPIVVVEDNSGKGIVFGSVVHLMEKQDGVGRPEAHPIAADSCLVGANAKAASSNRKLDNPLFATSQDVAARELDDPFGKWLCAAPSRKKQIRK